MVRFPPLELRAFAPLLFLGWIVTAYSILPLEEGSGVKSRVRSGSYAMRILVSIFALLKNLEFA